MERKLGTEISRNRVKKLFYNHARIIELITKQKQDEQMRAVVIERVKRDFPSGATVAEAMPIFIELCPSLGVTSKISYNYQTLRLLLIKHNLYRTIHMEP